MRYCAMRAMLTTLPLEHQGVTVNKLDEQWASLAATAAVSTATFSDALQTSSPDAERYDEEEKGEEGREACCWPRQKRQPGNAPDRWPLS